jgi:hypothetical protein
MNLESICSALLHKNGEIWNRQDAKSQLKRLLLYYPWSVVQVSNYTFSPLLIHPVFQFPLLPVLRPLTISCRSSTLRSGSLGNNTFTSLELYLLHFNYQRWTGDIFITFIFVFFFITFKPSKCGITQWESWFTLAVIVIVIWLPNAAASVLQLL